MAVYGASPYDPGLGGGISRATADLGSGVAIPPGLECVLGYNGLLLNMKANADRYRVISIDGLMDAQIRDSRDVNTDDFGEIPYNSFYGGRTVVIAGTIETHSVGKLRDMQRALRGAFLDITKERKLHFRTGDFSKDVVLYCKKVAPISGIEQQQGRTATRDFQITLACSDPRYLSYYPRFIEEWPSIQPSFVDLWTVESPGNYEARPIIRFYAPFTDAYINNDATGQTLNVNGTNLAAGDYLEFDMAARTLKNINGQNRWNLLADNSDYMSIVPGTNYFQYKGDCPHVTMLWHDAWL